MVTATITIVITTIIIVIMTVRAAAIVFTDHTTISIVAAIAATVALAADFISTCIEDAGLWVP